jgi:hypothetical protein
MNSIDNYACLSSAFNDDIQPLILVGGDDGLIFCPEELAASIERAAMNFGFKLKLKLVRPGETFTFLARRFAWFGQDSMMDVDRTMSKLNWLYTPLPESIQYERLLEKLKCLYQSDSNTPIVGQIIASHMVKVESIINTQPRRHSMNTKFSSGVGYVLRTMGSFPNALNDWMYSEVTSSQWYEGYVSQSS